MTGIAHNDPTGPFGYTPDNTKWDTAAGEALQRAQNFTDLSREGGARTRDPRIMSPLL